MVVSSFADQAGYRRLTLIYPQHESAEHVVALETAVGFGRTGKGVGGGDRHPCPNPGERTAQRRELRRARHAIIALDANPPPLARRRLDAVRVHHAPARFDEVEKTLELVSAGQSEHGVEAVGSEPAQLVDGRRAARVDARAGPERSAQASPGTRGKRGRAVRHDPSRIDASQTPTPAVSSEMRTSFGAGRGTGSSWSSRRDGGPKRSTAAACMVAGRALAFLFERVFMDTPPPWRRRANPGPPRRPATSGVAASPASHSRDRHRARKDFAREILFRLLDAWR